MFGVEFERTKVDQLMLEDRLKYSLEDEGISVYTDRGKIPVEFDPARFRPAEVPILLSDTSKIRRLQFEVKYTLQDIIKDQLNFYLDKANY